MLKTLQQIINDLVFCLTLMKSLFHALDIPLLLLMSSDVKDVLSDDIIDDLKST